MDTPLYPLSFQQKTLLSHNKENEDVITVTLNRPDVGKVPELLIKFLNTVEALKIKYIICDSLVGYNQSIRSSILLNQTDKENKNNFSSGKIHFSISKRKNFHDLVLRIPGGRLDSISLKLLAAKLKDYLEGTSLMEQACDYIGFACWQHEQPLIQLSEFLQQSIKATCATFKDFSERILLVTQDELLRNQGTWDSFSLRHFSGCSTKHLLKAFTWGALANVRYSKSCGGYLFFFEGRAWVAE